MPYNRFSEGGQGDLSSEGFIQRAMLAFVYGRRLLGERMYASMSDRNQMSPHFSRATGSGRMSRLA